MDAHVCTLHSLLVMDEPSPPNIIIYYSMDQYYYYHYLLHTLHTYYQTFPVWTQATLQDLRERKVKAEEIAVECMERLKEETRKMEETNNPLMKAMHFRNGTLCFLRLIVSVHCNHH